MKTLNLLVGLIFLLAGCGLNNDSSIQQSQGNISNPDQAPTVVALTTEKPAITPTVQRSIQLPTQQPAATSSALARFAIEASNVRLVEDQLWVDVCYLLPDTQDWMIGEAFLQIAGEKLPISGAA